MAMAVACSDEPEKPVVDEPAGSEVPSVTEPEGTLTVTLQDGKDLDGLALGADGKFLCKEGMIVCTGAAKSLADIKSIPTTGWREELAADEGKGYVYFHDGDYYRLRVSKRASGSAEVKYQTPFAGADEVPTFASTTLEFPAEGGSMHMVLSNASIVPFEIEGTTAAWCRAVPFGDLDAPFLANGILVEVKGVSGGVMPEERTAFTVATAGGRKVEVTVTRRSSESAYEMPEYLYCTRRGEVHVLTLPAAGLDVSSDAAWCTTYVKDNQLLVSLDETTEDRSAVLRIAGRPETVTVIQSKYDEGDVYDEGGVKGTVVKMEGAVRVVRSAKLGEAAYSTENKFAGALASSDGRLNMAKIKQMPDWQRRYPAFALCDALNTGGVSGWYLPALDEVWNLSGDMWLSTEASNKYAFSCEKESFGSVAGRESKQKVYAVYAHYRF